MVEGDGSQYALQHDDGHDEGHDDGHDEGHGEGHDEGQVVGSYLFLQVELHSVPALVCHDDDHEGHGRECRQGGVPHTPALVHGEGEGGCIPLVLE